jgi:hypothetical protein
LEFASSSSSVGWPASESPLAHPKIQMDKRKGQNTHENLSVGIDALPKARSVTLRQNFTHLVLTRFNTAVGYAPIAKGLETDWLTARLELFERYCLPSVSAQQDADFRWLIFFDAASPAWFKKKVSGFEPLVTPIYVEGEASDEVLRRHILQTGLVTSSHLLTTRLDNDDAIAKDHLGRVQRAFRGQDREFIRFPYGLQSFRGDLYQVYWPANPFLSLVEKVENGNRFTTVMCVRHDRVSDAGAIKQIQCSSQWLQTLHDSNLGNVLRGWPRFRSRSHPNFVVDWPEATSGDPIAARLKLSARGYGAWAKRAAGKVGVLLRK